MLTGFLHTRDGRLFRSVEVWVSPVDQLTDWHSASPAAMQKRALHAEGLSWNPAVAEETSLGHIR